VNPGLEAGGRLVIPSTREPGRLVGGAMLGAIGTGIGVQLARGISANQATTHAAWTGYIPAVLVFGGIALVFLLPGAAMLAYRREVWVDPGTHEVTERARYLAFWRTRSFPLSRFNAIVVARRYRTRSRRNRSAGRPGSSYRIFVVELASAAGKPLRVVVEQHEAPAREVAAKLTAMIDLPLLDQTTDPDDDE
jgi:hypothetical protein